MLLCVILLPLVFPGLVRCSFDENGYDTNPSVNITMRVESYCQRFHAPYSYIWITLTNTNSQSLVLNYDNFSVVLCNAIYHRPHRNLERGEVSIEPGQSLSWATSFQSNTANQFGFIHFSIVGFEYRGTRVITISNSRMVAFAPNINLQIFYATANTRINGVLRE